MSFGIGSRKNRNGKKILGILKKAPSKNFLGIFSDQPTFGQNFDIPLPSCTTRKSDHPRGFERSSTGSEVGLGVLNRDRGFLR